MLIACLSLLFGARNLLLDAAGSVRVADFGLAAAAKKDDSKDHHSKPVAWTAPEG